jgi:hypothetical protein
MKINRSVKTKWLLLMLFLGFLFNAFGQNKAFVKRYYYQPKLPLPKSFLSVTPKDEGHIRHCTNNKLLTREELRKIYPFRLAQKVVVSSYPEYYYPEEPKKAENKMQDSLKAKKQEILFDNLPREEIILNQQQIEQFADTFYNYGYVSIPTSDFDIKCFNPRHSVTFYDATNTAIANIEVCFECQK